MYHVAVHALAERVLAVIRQQDLLRAGDRIGVAVSGGADSVALLRLLLDLRSELGIVLSVVHFNHKLRGSESDEDRVFVADLACSHDLAFYESSGDVAAFAARARLSTEAAARELRYEFFRQLVGATGDAVIDKVATAHTLDDQAETVLIRLVRGTGLRGLGGIHPRVEVEDTSGDVCGEIVRPLLGVRRPELEIYLHSLGQAWREDSTNLEAKHTRNRVRQLLLPLVEREFNPAVRARLSEFSEIARGEEDYWDNELAGWMGTVVQWVEPHGAKKSSLVQIGAEKASGDEEELHLNALVDRRWFHSEAVAVQRRVLKAIGEIAGVPLDFKHVEEMRRFAEEGGKYLELPLGWRFEKQEESLALMIPNPSDEARDYEYVLPVPGEVRVPEVGSKFVAERADQLQRDNSDQLLDASLFAEKLVVRNWRPGDRFWPAHTKSPKKVKELLQDRNVVGSAKKLWPVVASGDDIVWVRGFPVPAALRAKDGAAAVVIREERGE
jgi:tRNA(Ile)-lysidine synthase